MEKSMRELFLMLSALILVTSCGSGSDDAAPVSNTENVEIREDLAVVEAACDVFSEDHNADAVSFQESFPSLYSECQNLTEEQTMNEQKSSALMESYKMAYEIFSSFDKDAHKSCLNRMKRVVKTSYHMARRALRPTNDQREKQQILAKSALDNHMRGLIAMGCLTDFENFTYLFKDEEKTFEFGKNHLRNGSFEIIKAANSNQFIELARQWTLLSNKKVPGWKVKAVVEQENKNCALLEVQGNGVTATSPEGAHLVELDGHCQNENGSRTSGDARVELSQSFHVKAPGSYRLTMKAQKRGGSHGELEMAVFQRNRDKEYQTAVLSNRAEWNDVCLDVEIVDVERTVKVAIRDGDVDGRSTYGLLLDDVVFEEGSCL